MTKIKISVSDAMNYLGGIGNIGYLWKFVDYFEKKLDVEIAPYIEQFPIIDMANYAYSNCPNFAAWLRFYVELVCNKTLASISRAEDCQKKIADYSFGPAIEAIVTIAKTESSKKGISESEFEKMAKALKTVMELRHTLQHGGMPNILRDIKFKDVKIEDIASMMTPQNYRETRKIFQSANKLLELLPKATIVMHKNGDVTLEKPEQK